MGFEWMRKWDKLQNGLAGRERGSKGVGDGGGDLRGGVFTGGKSFQGRGKGIRKRCRGWSHVRIGVPRGPLLGKLCGVLLEERFFNAKGEESKIRSEMMEKEKKFTAGDI